MKRRYQRRKKRNEDSATIGWLFAGALGLLYLAERVQADFAPQLQYVGPPRDTVDRIATSQEQNMWCWAAAIQMVLNSYGVALSQDQIVSQIYGCAINEPGTDAAITASLNGWAFDCLGKRILVQSRVVTGPPSLDVLMNEVALRHPILVISNQGGLAVGHAVVITGASHIRRRVASLVYRDPWPSPENCANYGRVELTESEIARFLSSIQSHWLISASFV